MTTSTESIAVELQQEDVEMIVSSPLLAPEAQEESASLSSSSSPAEADSDMEDLSFALQDQLTLAKQKVKQAKLQLREAKDQLRTLKIKEKLEKKQEKEKRQEERRANKSCTSERKNKCLRKTKSCGSRLSKTQPQQTREQMPKRRRNHDHKPNKSLSASHLVPVLAYGRDQYHNNA